MLGLNNHHSENIAEDQADRLQLACALLIVPTISDLKNERIVHFPPPVLCCLQARIPVKEMRSAILHDLMFGDLVE